MNAPLQVLISAAASFIIVSLIFGVIFLLCKRNRRSGLHPRQTRLRNPPTTTGSCYHPKTSSTVSALDESASFDPSLDRISMAELVAATRNFSADGIIGDGSFGFVYKAVLRGGATVAVKKLSPEAFQGLREFSAEMETLGRIRHPNLVRMLAFCAAGEERVLIYEFVQHGSLDQWLYPDITSLSASSSSNNYMKSQPLDWPRRKKIMTGVASGLCYLHEGCEPRIIHRDIKASNVLLDEDFGAHIADFGLARRMDGSHSHVSTQVAGTMGYMPPEYRDGLTVATVKADVYSFGILMFEVATGKRPNWPVKMDGGKEVGLIVWARRMVEEERHVDMIDPLVLAWCQKEMVGLDEVREFLRIAHVCTSESPKERPTMGEVVVMMSHLERGHDINNSSQPSICVV